VFSDKQTEIDLPLLKVEDADAEKTSTSKPAGIMSSIVGVRRLQLGASTGGELPRYGVDVDDEPALEQVGYRHPALPAIGVRAVNFRGGARHFCPKICVKNYQNRPNFVIFAPKHEQNSLVLHDFARKMPEFYIIIVRKIFIPIFFFFLGGGARASPVPSPLRLWHYPSPYLISNNGIHSIGWRLVITIHDIQHYRAASVLHWLVQNTSANCHFGSDVGSRLDYHDYFFTLKVSSFEGICCLFSKTRSRAYYTRFLIIHSMLKM